jgi:hypothetical protein
VRLPLKKAATIKHGNALIINWESIISKNDLNYILGNPPFIGKHFQSKEQKAEIENTFDNVTGAGLLDYVTSWFVLAAKYIQKTKIRVAFVSTNSISQGEQAGILWNILFNKFKIKIHFAHSTFKWTNEAKGNAAIHVVIIGFANFDIDRKALYEYEKINSEPQLRVVKNINPYLVEGKDLVLVSRRHPICDVKPIVNGNKPVDGGHLIFSESEKEEFLLNEPSAKEFFRIYVGAEDFIKGNIRWCLWLQNANPSRIKKMPLVMERIAKVKEFRLRSKKEYTRRKALTPSLFQQIRQPDKDYVLIPRVSSENRVYIPIGFVSKNVIVSDSATFIADPSLYIFGLVTSKMHMAWVRLTCGRLKSDYRYSNKLVYNNYPFPKNPDSKKKENVEKAAQTVLDTRTKYPNSNLADLYDHLAMPPDLVKAHQKLDKAVDLCYRPQPFPNQRKRVEFLFELYEEYTQPLLKEKNSF